MKKALCLTLTLAMLLTATLGMTAGALALPSGESRTNYADPSTLTLTNMDASVTALYATYNTEHNSIVLPQSGHGAQLSLAYKDLSAMAGKDYVISFSSTCRGWSNGWNAKMSFAKNSRFEQYITFGDMGVFYYDVIGTKHQLAGVEMNGANFTLAVYVRQADAGLVDIAFYLNNTLVTVFKGQPTLSPYLKFTGSEGTANYWNPEIKNLQAYTSGIKQGDVNGDGSVTVSDATALARYLANWDGYASSVNVVNADVNEDGVVSPLDMVALRRKLANWGGYTLPYVPTLNVVQQGVDNTGATDVTAKLTELHATGKRIYYPNGTYLFNGETLSFAGGVIFQSNDKVVIRNSISNEPIINFDDKGNLVGLQQNHLEKKYGEDTTTVIEGTGHHTPLTFAVYVRKEVDGSYKAYFYQGSKKGEVEIADSVDATLSFAGQYGDIGSTMKDINVYVMADATDATAPISNYRKLSKGDVVATGADLVLNGNATYDSSTATLTLGNTYGSLNTATIPAEKLASLEGKSYLISFQKTALDCGSGWYTNATVGTTASGCPMIVNMYNQDKDYTFTTPLITNGHLVSPPVSVADFATKVDFLPYWYNDFGNAAKPLGGSAGSLAWYDWSWNHHDCLDIEGVTDPYDPSRHPLLGYYYGDNATTLDWQCYWMREYGINQAVLLGCPYEEAKDPAHGNHWVYELLNNAPNAKTMKFALQNGASGYGMTYAEELAVFQELLDNFYFVDKYQDMVYCYEEDGKRYPVITLWDHESIRYSLDRSNGFSNLPETSRLYKAVADQFKAHGYDGVCLIARYPGNGYNAESATCLANLKNNGVLLFRGEYTENTMSSGSTYSERVAGYGIPSCANLVPAVATGMHTHDPHPSQWNCPGNTPALFKTLLGKAVNSATTASNCKKIVTCYNVSEWAEGGPGLVPNMQDGFGYLKAVRDSIKK